MVFRGRPFVLGIAMAFLIRPRLFSHFGGASSTLSIPAISLLRGFDFLSLETSDCASARYRVRRHS